MGGYAYPGKAVRTTRGVVEVMAVVVFGCRDMTAMCWGGGATVKRLRQRPSRLLRQRRVPMALRRLPGNGIGYRGRPKRQGLEQGVTGSEARQSMAGEGRAGDTGLQIFRASRLESLVAPLWALADQSWPDNVLEPQVLVAAHPGMKQWLVGQLARHNGRTGIAANLDVVLPSTWLDRLAQSRLGKRAVALPRYQRKHLRWTLHAMLAPGHAIPGLGDPRIAAYLSDQGSGPQPAAEVARRRFQLADRLARIYTQYLVYRPDWLKAWEAGHAAYASAGAGIDPALESQLLAPLWKALATRLGRHRAQAIEDLRASLLADDSPRPTVHVFGVNHLAPAELGVLRAYARQALVALYVPDPCREFWGGLGLDHGQWLQYRAQETERIARAGEGDYWQDQAHPLLARWGRMGQHFFSELADGEVREDVRHWQDEAAPVAGNRLQRLQESIRQLKPELMRVDLGDEAVLAAELADASLRVHACHTRQRELEVLRDQLLEAVSDGIAPGNMVVMAPDILAYLPLIPSVFGEPGSARERRLPYHLADVPVARSHPLFSTALQLLKLPGRRITAPEVMDLLAVDEVQRRLGLDAGAVESLGDWLRQSRVAWSLDGRHRAGFGVPGIAEHGFAWAVDRMIAGYLMSDAPEADREIAFALPDGTELVPVTGIQGPSAEALGALDRLLQELQAWCDLAAREMTARDWSTQLDQRLEALFRIDRGDAASRDAWDALKRFVRTIETEPAGADENPRLHFAVVRDLLADALAAVPERQRFLMGGITFCGMVPQRAIPFDFVAVLGLDDGVFPRSTSDGGLDLMSRIRRLGDRDVRSDDRYLFLETLMSARQRLHLGYLGEGVKDGKPRNPAAPLAELLAELDQAAGLTEPRQPRPWLVKHPLQPFDRRYFSGGDARLFSYSDSFAAMRGHGSGDAPAFLSGGGREPDPLPQPMDLGALAHYYKDPARNLLERRLKLRLDALDDELLADEEPLEAKVSAIETLARRLFLKDVLPAWPEGDWAPPQPPAWIRLGGLLPTGRMGRQAWEAERQGVNALLRAVREQGCLDRESAARARVMDVDVVLGSEGPDGPATCRITGRVAQVHSWPAGGPGALQLLRAFPKDGKLKTALRFGERVPMFLDWALLRLQTARAAADPGPLRLTVLAGKDAQGLPLAIADWDARFLAASGDARRVMLDDLEQRLLQLVIWWREAQSHPSRYFDRTSGAALSVVGAGDGSDLRKVLQEGSSKLVDAWDGGDHGTGERDFGQGYNALLGGSLDFEAVNGDVVALAEFAVALDDCIGLRGAPAGRV